MRCFPLQNVTQNAHEPCSGTGLKRSIGYDLHITVTSQLAPWRLKSPAAGMFAQPLVQAHIKENIEVPCHWPL